MIGESLECTEFQLLLFVGLRTLIDKLGAATFNVGIFNIGVSPSGANSSEAAPLLARCLPYLHWMYNLWCRCRFLLASLHGELSSVCNIRNVNTVLPIDQI